MVQREFRVLTIFADANSGVEILGVKLVGVNPENGQKLLLTLAFATTLLALGWFIPILGDWLMRGQRNTRLSFWTHQGVRIVVTVLMIFGVVSIWFEDPTRLATALGLVAAGLSFALQKVITSLAGYFVILRGKTFSVGDRIAMGGVRGDVVALIYQDDDHGNRPTSLLHECGRLHMGSQPPIHGPCGHRHQ